MCGICGIINKKLPINRGILEEMTKTLSHRGPDNSDSFVHGRVGLGHTRLSVIDLSQNGNQPMFDSSGKLSIVFNGEIYNFQFLRKELEKDNVRFNSNTDTEVILYMYQKYGVDCLQHLKGMFAFAIWDKREEKLFIARDRMGQKPLVYAETNEGFLFSSEINALLKHPSFSKEIDLEALDLFLSLQYIPAPWTIFKSVKKLPPAHFGLLTRTGLKIHRYWTLDYRKKIKISQEESLEVLKEKLTKAVSLRMISDVPMGTLLSGGVDSSLVNALMSQLSSEKVKSFSIGFKDEEFNELPYARKVAEHLNNEHHELMITPDIIESLPKIISQYGEPYGDKSAIPSFAVSEMARQNVTVALTGDGGDELAAGYWRYDRSRSQRLADNFFDRINQAPPDLYYSEKLLNFKSIWDRIRRKWIFSYKYPELIELFYGSFWCEPDKSALWKQGLRRNHDITNKWRNDIFSHAKQHALTRIDRMLCILNNTYLPYDNLVKMDIASMSYGLEVRSPLVDHELAEWYATLPNSIRTFKGESKYLLKKLASQYVPSEVIYRTKKGFSVPVSQWLRGDMSYYLKSVLTDRASGLDQYFNKKTVLRFMDEHLSGGKNHGFRLWALLIFSIWYEQTYNN